ncbi:MAG: M3 family oligoendopeptidase [Termitinemataceae bacterium]|nr:MAG: M3 family oligoendopeptidase [Termitinemataceae bacterium]
MFTKFARLVRVATGHAKLLWRHPMNVPRWNLDSIYVSFDSPQYIGDFDLLHDRLDSFTKLATKCGKLDEMPLLKLINCYEQARDIAANLKAYAYVVYSCDTRDTRAMAEINAVEEAELPLNNATVIFRNLLAEQKDTVLKLAAESKTIAPYSFFLQEAITKADFQMAANEEDIANDLSRCGGEAWSRLHDALASTASVTLDGKLITLNECRALAHDPNRKTRQKAYKAEIEAWQAIEIPMAASLNGVKGWSTTLDKRRGWKSPLAKAAFQARISEKTLYALISAMESSLPMFQSYLNTKAKVLGIEKCAFYDIFAPVGTLSKKWSWDEACSYTADRFGEFDPLMADFARRAYKENWVDAEMRAGKIGGAYCEDFPLSGESRILCNFDGTFDALSTVAHETGHAWHHEIVKNLSCLQSAYPMTLAETASTFAETLVFEGALKSASANERIVLLEENIQNSCQLIVDILSRYYFEKAVFEAREKSELSPAEYCGLMLDAQKKTYGTALNYDELHPYMWAVKVHYYSPSLAFYNFPYAFGCLFSLALYNRAKTDGHSFAAKYRNLLSKTGMANAQEIGKIAGFDIETESFWQSGLEIIKANIEAFQKSGCCKK